MWRGIPCCLCFACKQSPFTNELNLHPFSVECALRRFVVEPCRYATGAMSSVENSTQLRTASVPRGILLPGPNVVAALLKQGTATSTDLLLAVNVAITATPADGVSPSPAAVPSVTPSPSPRPSSGTPSRAPASGTLTATPSPTTTLPTVVVSPSPSPSTTSFTDPPVSWSVCDTVDVSGQAWTSVGYTPTVPTAWRTATSPMGFGTFGAPAPTLFPLAQGSATARPRTYVRKQWVLCQGNVRV